MENNYILCKEEEDARSSLQSLIEEDSLLEQARSAKPLLAKSSWKRSFLTHSCYIAVYGCLSVFLAHVFSAHYHGPGLIFCEGIRSTSWAPALTLYSTGTRCREIRGTRRNG